MVRWRAIGSAVLFLALATAGCLPSHVPGTSRAPDAARAGERAPAPAGAAHGAVASAEAEASAVGAGILRRGGGAVDAAVAVALALAVVHPQAGNLGGGGFAVVRWQGEVAALDFRETAPAAARRDMFQDARGDPIPGASLVGPLAAGVPGSPSGLHALHRRFGRLPWADVVAPAVRLARDGFTVTPRLRGAIESERDGLTRFPESSSVWLPGGEPPRAGVTMRLPDLADTLEAYGAIGPEAITGGRVATAIEAASARHGGLLTAADLAGYRPVWREPVRFEAFGWSVASMPLPSAGGIILGQSMLMLERLGWQGLPRGSIERVHLLAEVWRRAYADRLLLGDPAAARAGPAQLLDPDWIARRAGAIDPARATPSRQVRSWPAAASDAPAETTHVSVADGDGNLVALTTTLNGWFGCYLHVAGAGFLLNNEMDDFTTVPNRPNLYGLVQGEANAVSPGARMLSSMTPTIAWRGATAVALGSPGGSRIPTATMQVLLGVIVDDDPLRDAVLRPRVHHQWLPDELRHEAGALDGPAEEALARRGHRLAPMRQIGEVHVVRVEGRGRAEAFADPRGPGGAVVVDPQTAARAAPSGRPDPRPPRRPAGPAG